jgi:hypothetical protein
VYLRINNGTYQVGSWNGSNSNALVTLSIASGPAGAVLGGHTTVRAVNGVATFSDLRLSKPGTYTLKATGGILTPDTSNSFSVTPANVTADLTIQRGLPLSFANGYGVPLLFEQTVTLTNTSARVLAGPLALLVQGVPSGVTLLHAGGTYQGSPYLEFRSAVGVLAPGQHVTVTLVFAGQHHAGNGDDFSYQLTALQGL